MKVRLRWPWIAIVALALLWPGWGQEGKGLSLGQKAPDFAVQRVDGKTVSLKDFRGNVLYLDFFATW